MHDTDSVRLACKLDMPSQLCGVRSGILIACICNVDKRKDGNTQVCK